MGYASFALATAVNNNNRPRSSSPKRSSFVTFVGYSPYDDDDSMPDYTSAQRKDNLKLYACKKIYELHIPLHQEQQNTAIRYACLCALVAVCIGWFFSRTLWVGLVMGLVAGYFAYAPPVVSKYRLKYNILDAMWIATNLTTGIEHKFFYTNPNDIGTDMGMV